MVAAAGFSLLMALVSMSPNTNAGEINKMYVLSPSGDWSTCHLKRYMHDFRTNRLEVHVMGGRCFVKKKGKPKPTRNRRRK
jgi:dihydrofolate reductase